MKSNGWRTPAEYEYWLEHMEARDRETVKRYREVMRPSMRIRGFVVFGAVCIVVLSIYWVVSMFWR